jgi:hypothetical protein
MKKLLSDNKKIFNGLSSYKIRLFPNIADTDKCKYFSSFYANEITFPETHFVLFQFMLKSKKGDYELNESRWPNEKMERTGKAEA